MTQVLTCEISDKIALVTFDVKGDAVNTWTEEAVRDFEEVLKLLEDRQSELKGAIFVSGKKGNFHAGANLNVLEGADPEAFRDRCRFFNALFVRLENLSIPTIAAIDGQCMGGGYEFALAMTARIATDSRKTLVGLPECNVGVIPGGGGTQRLPRLIGYDAIGMILQGQVLPAQAALAAGLVDRVVAEADDIKAQAIIFLDEISAGKAQLKREKQDFSAIDDVVELARKGVLKATKGREIPGPLLALKAMQQGLKTDLVSGLEIETGCFIEVLKTPESKGMINTFFLKTLSDKPQAMIPRNVTPKDLNKFAVLGLGTMGRGIVIDILRRTGKPVVVKDLAAAIEPGLAFVRKILQGMADKGRLKADVDELMRLVIPVTEFTDEFKDVDCVIEAVFEDPALKDEVYTDLCQVLSPDAIIASNTSSLPVNRLSAKVVNPERFAGAHFFSPVWKMQLLEIIRGQATSDATVFSLLALCAKLKKRPVVCRDNPGFVVNAMLFPYFRKSFELLEEGVPIEQIDKAMMRFGLPVGPIRLTDEVGIDTSYLVLTKSLGQVPPAALENVYQAGRYGRNKNGKGFYGADGQVDPEVLPLINPQGNSKTYTEEELQSMLFVPFVEVGKELLDKGIVENPRSIDIGAIWGVGFPPDKGGPMKWADLTGLSQKLFSKKFY